LNKTLRQILRFSLFLILGLLLLYFAFRGIDFDDMRETFRHTRYGWILLSFVFAILAHISRARRWMLIIRPLNFRPSLWNTYNALMFGYLANFAFPRIGEITRCVSLGKKEKIPVDSLIGTVIVERALDLIMALLIMLVLLLTRFEKFGIFFTSYIIDPMQDKFIALFGGVWIIWLIAALLFITAVVLVYIFREKLYRFRLIRKVGGVFRGIIEGLKTISRLQRKWEFIFHTLFIWINYAMMTWVVVFALPGVTDHLKFVDGIFLLVVGSMGMAAPVQSGIGAFHWLVSRGLFYVYGLSLSDGLVFATLQHTSQMILVLLLGSTSMLFIFSGKKSDEHKDTSPDHAAS
jgi:uncharacterized protein (TIRG00374 family)